VIILIAEHLLSFSTIQTEFKAVRTESHHPSLVSAKSCAIRASLQPAQKEFDQMMQILTGYFVTRTAGALATYSIADHLISRLITK